MNGKFREFQISRELPSPLVLETSGPSRTVWTPPPTHFIKLNSDVAFKSGGCFAGESNRMICGVHVFKEKCSLPAAGECFGILKTVQAACQE